MAHGIEIASGLDCMFLDEHNAERYPTGFGGISATSTDSILEGASLVSIHQLFLVEGTGVSGAYQIDADTGSGYSLIYQQGVGPVEAPTVLFDFGDEGFAVPGPIRISSNGATLKNVVLTFRRLS